MLGTNRYYKKERPEIIRHIRSGDNVILDIGCAEGVFGSQLKKQGIAQTVIGIELLPEAAKMAGSVLDRVICGDVETLDLHAHGLRNRMFDYIICNDVLEHLRDPEPVVRNLVELLKPEGRMITSIPNVRYWRVVFPLLFKGSWEYQDEGILDRGHLRFYTLASAMRLLCSSGLDIVQSVPLMHRRSDRLCNKASFSILQGLFAFQWLIIACKNHNNA